MVKTTMAMTMTAAKKQVIPQGIFVFFLLKSNIYTL